MALSVNFYQTTRRNIREDTGCTCRKFRISQVQNVLYNVWLLSFEPRPGPNIVLPGPGPCRPLREVIFIPAAVRTWKKSYGSIVNLCNNFSRSVVDARMSLAFGKSTELSVFLSMNQNWALQYRNPSVFEQLVHAFSLIRDAQINTCFSIYEPIFAYTKLLPLANRSLFPTPLLGKLWKINSRFTSFRLTSSFEGTN
jgi:hypothetical protein